MIESPRMRDGKGSNAKPTMEKGIREDVHAVQQENKRTFFLWLNKK